MLFTITYTGENAADLGYLLHKNPSRPQTADFSYGRVHVFYPEVQAERCTAALLLDMDPIDLARGRPGSRARGLFDYVNDRPYVSSSFMSTAISRVYGTAMSGRCEKKPELVNKELDLSASLTMLPCRGNTAMLEKVFAPLGYELSWEESLLDERFPEWGQARYVNLNLHGKQKLMNLLRHIYVLIPVFDFRKHYWIGEGEVDKLLSHGESWLETHPEKNFITHRYFTKLHRYARIALERMERFDNGEGGAGSGSAVSMEDDDVTQGNNEAAVNQPLNDLRLAAVASELKACKAELIIDLGCGEGNLLRLLSKEKCFTALAGSDVSLNALERAAEKLKIELPREAAGIMGNEAKERKRLKLFQGSLCYRDRRFKGYDAAVIMEVIEHLDENRLPALCSVVFGDAAPNTVIITTPNSEYNVYYPGLAGRFRHPDHRFEWNRAQFRAWAEALAACYGYSLRIEGIGQCSEEEGYPTQMGIFTKMPPDLTIESASITAVKDDGGAA